MAGSKPLVGFELVKQIQVVVREVSFATVFLGVSRNSLFRGELCDIPKNGCRGDYGQSGSRTRDLWIVSPTLLTTPPRCLQHF